MAELGSHPGLAPRPLSSALNRRGQPRPSQASLSSSRERGDRVGQSRWGLRSPRDPGHQAGAWGACGPLTGRGAWGAAGTSQAGAAGCLRGSGSCRGAETEQVEEQTPVTPSPCLGGGGGGRMGKKGGRGCWGWSVGGGGGAGRRHRQENHSQGLQARGAFEVWELLNVGGSIQGPGGRASSSEDGARACPHHAQPPRLPTGSCSPPTPLHRPSSLVEARHGRAGSTQP